MKKILGVLLLTVLGCNPMQSGKPLPFKKIIFEEKEVSYFQIFDKKKNKEIGEAAVEIKKEKIAGEEIYRFISQVKENKLKTEVRCDLHPQTFVPILSEKTIKGRESYQITSYYKGGKNFANIVIKGKKINKKLQLEVSPHFYENETVIFLLRNFDINFWKNKEEVKFNVIIPQVGQHCVAVAKLSEEEEKIKFKEGDILTYKIEMTAENTQKHYIWYEKENPRRIIKYENEENIYFLSEK